MKEESFRHLLEEGAHAARRGEYYWAHERWEDLWRELEDPERSWVQALIQVATAQHKLTHGQPSPALRLLKKARRKLEGAPDDLHGLDVGGLRGSVATAIAALERGERVDPTAVTVRLRGG